MSELQSPNPPIGSLSLEFVEGLLADYTRNPDSVAPDWRRYFDELTHGQNGGAVESTGNGHAGLSGNGDGNGSTFKQLGPSFRPVSLFKPPRPAHAEIAPPPTQRPRVPAEQWNIAVSQDRVDQLIRAYRVRGHLVAQIDPLGLPRPELPELELSFYGLTEADLDREFSTATIEGPQSMTLRRIIERLRNTYCRSIGVQFMHMDDLKVRQWLQERMEGTENRCVLSRKEQLRILNGLTSAAVFEEFIQRRFLGAKSFSLEGAETLDSAVGPGHRKGGRAQHRRNRAGHGPSRPAECAGQHHGQKPAADFPRIRRHRSGTAHRPRRREVSPGPFHRYQNLVRPAASTCRSASIPATWSSSIRWRSAACGPSKIAWTITNVAAAWRC